MITDKPAAFTPEDLFDNVQRLRADLHVIQNELDQALNVWRAILSTEKQEFKKLLEDHEKSWDKDEGQWQKDRQAYEQKIIDLGDFFTKQLGATEKNAVKALNELDTAWQQERLRWQQTVAQDAKENRQRDELHLASQQQMEQQVSHLVGENQQLRASQNQIDTIDAQRAAWEAEKSAWETTLAAHTSERRRLEDAWTEERQRKDALITALQDERVSLEQKLRDSESEKSAHQGQFSRYINMLENQITSLQELIQQLTPARPAQPQRRKGEPAFKPTPLPPFRAYSSSA